MQERQVTLGGVTRKLPDPFLVMATQNPLDQEGTYQLPEAQLDRFLLKVTVGYPSRTEERAILDLMGTTAAKPKTSQVTDKETVAKARQSVGDIYIDDSIKDYIVSLVFGTREPETISTELKPLVRCGASPRATINLALAARATAFLAGRGYVVPSDVKNIAPDVLRHRILVTYEAEAENVDSDQIIARLLDSVPVP
jgi:MoxR-like ATPase